MTKMTQAERLARIEAIVEGNAKTSAEAIQMLRDFDDKWTVRFDALEAEHRADVANLAALENKGKGAFAALSVMFVTLGAFAKALWDGFIN